MCFFSNKTAANLDPKQLQEAEEERSQKLSLFLQLIQEMTLFSTFLLHPSFTRVVLELVDTDGCTSACLKGFEILETLVNQFMRYQAVKNHQPMSTG